MTIEINLLPKKVKEEKRARLIYTYIALGVLAVVGVALYIVWMQMQRIAKVEAEISKIEAQAASLSDKIAQVRKFKALEDTYNKKKAVIDKLIKDQSLWARILDDIAFMLPADMWLMILEQSKEKTEGVIIRLEGFAMNKAVIAEFIKNLEQSGKVMDIAVETMRDQEDSGVNVVFLKMVFLYKFPV